MNSKIDLTSPIVSIDWLHDRLGSASIVVLDGTINKVFDDSQNQIPNARFFDIKKVFSDTENPFPSAFPSAEQFQREARKLGINNDSTIVVYDDKGIYSSARVWWLFRAFGYNNIAVLNGGFPAWLKSEYPVEPMELYSGPHGNFTTNLQPKHMMFFTDMQYASKHKTHTIIDARSADRFNGIASEPREGLRSGTIPNSDNLPYTALLQDGVLKPKKQLETLFESLAKHEDNIVFSCGSGITACVLALGAELSGYQNISVYDGSWTEWGSLVKE